MRQTLIHISTWDYIFSFISFSIYRLDRISKLHLWLQQETFQNAYEPLNVRALKTSTLYKIYLSMYALDIWVEFQRYPFQFHKNILPTQWNMCILFSCKDIRTIIFKSSKVFLKRSPDELPSTTCTILDREFIGHMITNKFILKGPIYSNANRDKKCKWVKCIFWCTLLFVFTSKFSGCHKNPSSRAEPVGWPTKHVARPYFAQEWW